MGTLSLNCNTDAENSGKDTVELQRCPDTGVGHRRGLRGFVADSTTVGIELVLPPLGHKAHRELFEV